MPTASPRCWLSFCFASTILISAFLVFQVQPLLSKCILPWFGGTPAVWTTCMLFFQVLLFLGYAYAHVSTKLLRPARQGFVHLCLIFLALSLLPITPDASWKPASDDNPTWRILTLLTASVGLPYFLLSSTGPLVQAWFSRSQPGRSPYRLYALSNLGSLAALVSYPFLVEPVLATRAQGDWWSVGFSLFGLFCGLCALRMWKRDGGEPATPATGPEPNGADDRPTAAGSLAWLALAAIASAMMLAITNHVCQDVAVIPFLWVVPLSLYLLSFILCFEKEAWYSRRWFGLGLLLSLLGVAATMMSTSPYHLAVDLSINFAALFFISVVCHGELVRRKPSPRHLTQFYLMSAGGGALGGIFVGLIAPLAFTTNVEFKLGLMLCYLLAVAVIACDEQAWFRGRPRWSLACGLLAFCGFFALSRTHDGLTLGKVIHSARNFYGTLCVDELPASDPAQRGFALRHGRIMHGLQFTAADKRRQPTTYFSPASGIGLAMAHHPRAGSLRVGIVGLGVGTIAAYGGPRDYLRFYEINPQVIDVAHRHFTFLADCPGRVDVVLGDARLSLEREPSQQFDVLVLDAFSGDAIPTHLLTQEAFQIYLRHLRRDGVLALHITNRHVDLNPVVRGLAEHFGFAVVNVETQVDLVAARAASSWVLLTNNASLLASPGLRDAVHHGPRQYAGAPYPLWRDDFSNLLEVLR